MENDHRIISSEPRTCCALNRRQLTQRHPQLRVAPHGASPGSLASDSAPTPRPQPPMRLCLSDRAPSPPAPRLPCPVPPATICHTRFHRHLLWDGPLSTSCLPCLTARLSCTTQTACSAGCPEHGLADGGARDLSAGMMEGVVLVKLPRRAVHTAGAGSGSAPEEGACPGRCALSLPCR